MPTPTDTTNSTDATADPPEDDFTVTPYAVTGEVDYDKLLERFGADPLTDDQIKRFPDHPLLRRRTFYAGRDVDSYLDAAAAGEPHAIVTGRGPSGPMHLGHVLPLYLAKRFQQETGATVYIPLSDDEKFLAKAQSFESIGEHTHENLRDVLAVGFDPERTRIVVDTADADVVYPIAVRLAKHLTPATVEAVYGEQDTVGLQFYPAVQATHLLLPQLVAGRQPTLVPIAIDQDPHVRICRDVAAKEALPVDKPGALLGRFLPSLAGPGKMSSSGDAPSIELTADYDTVAETIHTHAYTGGRATLEEHREHGGDPAVDVPFQYLRFFFEEDDDALDSIADAYRAGDLLSGELKELAIERITDFLAAHQRRRAELDGISNELESYRLTDDERRRALERAGVPRVLENYSH
ncbi:tryptophan--tRNA ligase [Natrialba magadii ATCC 43099]|uniref:Tryptophan--tRNA ligase n=1 Tax=Natrialba magadii (strain ATCC 43099 / DSM 3394 / CCM 3739 / CIP 104546 / IAM 13178 / JCM 8861 / NBRC 102185 / NCIMB 2190 / MS3) TaxID=547559 RepID=D3SVZ7_NATMM|nr:tryptophan--tRNA ligase [Natrialba magadii]ADD05658.1 tryptophan--tRNA ligase [Natrialba magadii ATCC 43099]ELY29930.1 tryptophanyl-tRNA synthetase [Natrialba magadii ATCC 43099]